MNIVRFLLLNAFIAVFSIFFCVWGLILSLFDRKGHRVHRYSAVPWARGILRVCGIRVRCVGAQNVASDRPCIYMTNHQSYFDIFALLAYLPVDFKFVVKQELMGIPLLGITMRRAGYIGIKREKPRQAIRSIREAAEKIRDGASVVIFPEGTRSRDGRLQPFKRGGFDLALRSGCDIVPVTIRDSYRIVPKGSLRINKGSFDIFIGRPIPVAGYGRKTVGQLMGRVRDAMLSQMGEHGTQAKES
jgi:1-acyl-sn-glycerol-3-phosphate acyltransferase